MEQHHETPAEKEVLARRNILPRLGKAFLLAAAALSFHRIFAVGKAVAQEKKTNPLGIKEVTTTNQFLGEIIPWPMGFAPKNWAICDGRTLPINQNTALFSLLGTTYGGDGIRTFNLPDLRGRMPVHVGTNYQLGQTSGEETNTLLISQLPSHLHNVKVSTGGGTSNAPLNNVPAVSTEGVRQYGTSIDQIMEADAVSSVGGSQPHDNMPPYLVINYIIALAGIYPSRS